MINWLLRSLKQQLGEIYPLMLKVYFPAILLLLTIGIISWRTKIPIMDFTRDPISIMDAPAYLGLLSNIGIIFWAAGATVCFFAAMMISPVKHYKKNFYFLLWGGIVTTILLIDDFFLLHEQVFPQLFNTSENQIYFLYFLMLLAYFVFFWKKILNTDFILIIFFGLGFIISVLVDEILVDHFRGKFLIEDGFKLLGILSWTAYFTRVSMIDIKSCLKQIN